MRSFPPRLGAVLLGIVILSWFIPYLHMRGSQSESYTLRGYYCAELNQFLMMEYGADSLRFRSEKGVSYKMKDARLLLPLLYIHDAEESGGFPLEFEGRLISAKEAGEQMQFNSLAPRDIYPAPLPLHALLESEPDIPELSRPSDMLVLRPDRLVFLDCATGAELVEKTAAFNEALAEAGVVFPITCFANNPSTLKAFDEGAFLTDATNALFQLKLVQGRPVCRATGVRLEEPAVFLQVEEHSQRLYYGLVATKTALYLNMYAGGLQRLPLDYEATSHSVSVMVNPAFYSLVSTSLADRQEDMREPVRLAAVRRDFSPLHDYAEPYPERIRQEAETTRKRQSFLAPFALVQYTAATGSVQFLVRPAAAPLWAVAGIACCLLVYAAIMHIRSRRQDPVGLICIALTGLPGLVAVICFGPLTSLGGGAKAPPRSRG